MRPVSESEETLPRPDPREVRRRIVARFAPHRRHLAAACAAATASVGLSAVSPLLLERVINVALPEHDVGLLVLLCTTMVVTAVLGSVTAAGLAVAISAAGQSVTRRLRTDVYGRVQRLPLRFFARQPKSEIQTRLVSDIGEINDLLTFTAQTLFLSITNLLVSVVVMMILSWPLALASLALAVALSLLNDRFARRQRRLAEQRQESVSRMLKLVDEDLSLPGVILGRTLGRHNAQRQRFVATAEDIAGLGHRQQRTGAAGRALVGMTLTCVPPIIYLLSGTVIPGLSLGAVVVIAMLQARISMPVDTLLGLSGRVQAAMPAFERVFAYLDLRPEPATDPAADPVDEEGSADAVTGPVRLRARRLSYRYADTEPEALRDASLDLSPGSTTLIVGSTGSGKSTLGLLLAGLLEPTSGNVEIDGRPVRGRELWTHVTLVTQEAAIFNASLRENLLFAAPEATDDRIRGVIADAQLSDLADRLEDGLDTVVGEHGFQLSGGERQRLSLARAMLTTSPVLIVDEATSALDGVTAENVYRSLSRRFRASAIVVIAHRIPRLGPSDHAIVVEHGRIVERGSHTELLADGKVYPELLDAQNGRRHSGEDSEAFVPWYASDSQPSQAEAPVAAARGPATRSWSAEKEGHS